MVGAGLVRSEHRGNMRYFQAHAQSPVYAELVALTRKTLGVVPVLQEALAPLLPKLQAAWVYGSVARETDTAQSDVDVLLVGPMPTPVTNIQAQKIGRGVSARSPDIR